jgi:hypothetical protein
VAVVLILGACAYGQDARESLGAGIDPKQKGPHPLLQVMAAHPAAMKAELVGVHPRVFFTDGELAVLRERAKTTHKDIWQHALSTMIALQQEPAAAPAQERRAQNDVGLGIAEAAFAYRIDGDPKYLAIAKRYMDAAVSYDIWGYASSKPNIDLGAGHLLYGMGIGYDLLYHDLSEAEREKYRNKIVKQARLLYASYELKPGKHFSYSQNHLFIPAAGLGVAAYALYGEVPEAADWARTVRALYDRVLETYSVDGYYYEGFEYWVFSTPWIVHYLDALEHSTGEDLYDNPGLRKSYLYVAHSILPDGKNVFDFGDVFSGPLTRLGKSEEIERTHPGGHLHSNYILIYRLAQKFHDGNAQGVADWLASLHQTSFEDYWALAWYEPGIKATPIEEQPTSHYFPDNEVIYWRSSWKSDATAFAFKCGPPEGHHIAPLIAKYPDWHQEQGHAHPDAGAFILFAKNQYLSGVSGYAGVPMTEHNNTLLIDGHGQAAEGAGHNAFADYPYGRLNEIRIVDVHVDADGARITGDATSAYDVKLGLTKFTREVSINASSLSITDQVETSSARTPAILFHFDGGDRPAGLTIDVVSPKDAVTRMEPNILTTPGPPGHVDKGVKEQRGTRLNVSTKTPATQTTVETKLSW